MNRSFRPLIAPVPRGPAPLSIGLALPFDAPGGAPLLGTPGLPAYAVETYPASNLVTFDADDPGSWTIVGPVTGTSIVDGDFLNGDFGTMYVLDAHNLYAMETATAAYTLIGPAPTYNGEFWSGLAGGRDGVLYGASHGGNRATLYTIDPATGATTVIGEITHAPWTMDIAVNALGEIYGVDISSNVLVKIDPSTGAATVVGSLGLENISSFDGIDFEEPSGILYMVAHNLNSNQGELYTIDLSTGHCVLAGTLPDGAYVGCLSFATGSSNVPWLWESPVAGTLLGMAEQPVTVGLDAGVVDQPGDYSANLLIKNGTYGNLPVTVTMTVLPPGDMGKIAGLVLDNCDQEPVEATITFPSGMPITQTQADGDTGSYSAWLVAGAYAMSLTAAGYQGYSTSVDVAAGQTTTLQINMVPDHACISVGSSSYEVWVLTGTKEVRAQAFTNDGGRPLTYEYSERPDGYAPPPLGAAEPFLPASAPVSIGPAPQIRAPDGSATSPLAGILGAQAYAIDVQSENLVSFNSGTPIRVSCAELLSALRSSAR